MQSNNHHQDSRADGCAEHLCLCDEIHRQEIYTTLEHQRLTRKYGDVVRLYQGDAKSSWNELFYLLFMRTLGDELNRDAFLELARRLPLSILMRERSSTLSLEAMLVATSGLLERYSNKEYSSPLVAEAGYLLKKHNVTPLSFKQWRLGRIRPYNHPVVRLSQVASIITSREFIFGDTLQCTTQKDVDELFCVATTPHLISTHSYLTGHGQRDELRIGATKRALIGINLVVPLQYAYGCYVHDDDICIRALELNQGLPAEDNRYINRWRSCGLNPHSAFETQALIQLTTQYCKKQMCAECPVGKRIAAGVI